jgi:hypothetical protein
VVALAATMLFCLSLSFVTMRLFGRQDGDGWFYVHGTVCFVCLFLAMTISAVFAGHALIRIYIKYGWRDVSKLPEIRERTKYVAFITKEHCLYNGVYDKEEKLFTTYDGLVFRQSEIISWCNDRNLNYMIKYVEYPTDNLYERNG